MPKNSGFTLVELMITLAVAAILLSLAAPSFSTMLKNNRRAADVNGLVADINLARSEAVKRANRVGICRTSNYTAAVPTCGNGNGWEDGWIVFNDENNSNTPDNAIDILRRHPPMNDNITIRGNSNVATVIAYLATGRLNGANNGTIAWCDDRGAGPDGREIVIAPSGRVRTVDNAADCTP